MTTCLISPMSIILLLHLKFVAKLTRRVTNMHTTLMSRVAQLRLRFSPKSTVSPPPLPGVQGSFLFRFYHLKIKKITKYSIFNTILLKEA